MASEMVFQAKQKTDIVRFLELAGSLPVIDVRSPSEFMSGHIPGAHNIPLFDDREREMVGIAYKKEGRIKAVTEGLKLTGPGMHSRLERALEIAGDNKILVHCWRGGMRSEAMAWLFSLGGIDAEILEGGYKAYRHFILESLASERKIIILGGLTGSGKTEILRHIKRQGNQVIDLEGLANHKGSAFGSLGQLPQPSSEHFANLLFDEWRSTDPGKPLWLEDESHNIGKVFMPEGFHKNMQKNPVIVLLMDISVRMPRLIGEYSKYPAEDLVESVKRISKRIGGENAENAVRAVESGDFERAVEIVLQYYDKTYLYGIKKKESKDIVYIKTDTDDVPVNASKILEAAAALASLQDR